MTTTMLTQATFDQARQFIEQKGRSIDIARFHHAFDNAPADSVIAALKAFQNSDGGFGHGLEPDLRTPASSVLCTSIAFQVLRTLPANSGNELALPAITYLIETFDQKQSHWPIIPKAAQASPRAPWWERPDDNDVSEAFSLNPTAEILGYLYDYQKQVPPEILTQVTERVTSHLADIDTLEMHDLLCCLRLVQTPPLPETIRDQIQQILTQQIQATVSQDPNEWSGYCLRPLQIVDHPDLPFMSGLEDAIAANLDYEIASQTADGAWEPTWTWGDRFPDEWQQAKQDWSGMITMETLLLLKRFGRIETVESFV